MSSHHTPPDDRPDQPVGDLDHAIVELLGDAALWEEPPPEVEDAVVAAIAAGGEQRARVEGIHARRADRDRPRDHHRRRSAAAGAALGVAAALVLLLIGVGVDVVRIDRSRGDVPAATVVALQAVEGGPAGAAGAAAFQDLPDGTRIELQVSELPPAPPGEWYEMHLLPPGDPPVSAGSFHLRGGGGRVVLWAGIALGPDVVVEVTRQPEGTRVLAGSP